MSRRFPRTALAAALALMVPAASMAADNAICTAPGVTVLTDSEGDVQPGFVTQFAELPVGLPLDFADLLTVQVAQQVVDEQLQLVFTISVPSLTTLPILPPNAVWFTSFEAPNKSLRGVRMSTDQTGAPTFFSYAVDTGGLQGDGPSDGRFIVDGSAKPADPASGFAGGTITIVVKASDVGVRNAGDMLSRFNAAMVMSFVVEGVGGYADTFDELPTGLGRDGVVTIASEDECKAEGKSGLQQAFGGAFGGLALLLMGLGAALRRRA